MEKIINYLNSLTTQDYIGLALGLLVIILLFIFKEAKIVVEVVGKAVVEAETTLNGEEGQKKLDYAVQKVQELLPKPIKAFVTKSLIVTIIEVMLKFMNDAFKLNKNIDIKGNE